MTGALLLAGCSAAEPDAAPAGPAPSSTGTGGTAPSTATEDAVEPDDETEAEEPEADGAAEPARPVSVLGLAEQRHRGDRLTLGAVRERTAAYTSYDVTYRSRSTTDRGEESYRISGVLNVPTGRGPFPAVVLAHGYIDPAFYVRGQGMTRERGFLASRGLRRAARRLPQPRGVRRRPALPVPDAAGLLAPTSSTPSRRCGARPTSRSTTTGSPCSAARWAVG